MQGAESIPVKENEFDWDFPPPFYSKITKRLDYSESTRGFEERHSRDDHHPHIGNDHFSFPYSSRGNSHHCSTTSSICSYNNSDNEETFTDHVPDHLKVFNDDKAIAYRPLNPMVKNLLGENGFLSDDENCEDFQSLESEIFCRKFKNLSTNAPCNPGFSIPSSACTTAEKSSFIQVDDDYEGTKHDSSWEQVSCPSFHLGVSDLSSRSGSINGRVRTKKRHRTPTTCSPLMTAINHSDGPNYNNPNNNGRSRSSSLSTSSHYNVSSSTTSSSPNCNFRSIRRTSSPQKASMPSSHYYRDSPHSHASHMDGICLEHGASSVDCIAGETNSCMTDALSFTPIQINTDESSSSTVTTSIINGLSIGGSIGSKGTTTHWGSTTLKEVLPSSGSHRNTHNADGTVPSITYPSTANTDATTTTTTSTTNKQRKFKRHALMQAEEVASFYAQSNLLNNNNSMQFLEKN